MRLKREPATSVRRAVSSSSAGPTASSTITRETARCDRSRKAGQRDGAFDAHAERAQDVRQNALAAALCQDHKAGAGRVEVREVEMDFFRAVDIEPPSLSYGPLVNEPVGRAQSLGDLQRPGLDPQRPAFNLAAHLDVLTHETASSFSY
jgi:hypothetical protein